MEPNPQVQTSPLTCPFCHTAVLQAYFFCPNCGKELHPPPFSISIQRQIGIYLLSFFLAPLGLVPAIHYLQKNDSKAKTVGIVSIALTIISILISIYFVWDYMNKYSQILKSMGY